MVTVSSRALRHIDSVAGMETTRVRTFFILTLLQVCRTQTQNNTSESWYLANLINDGFQPKSISEIFSTESPFSITNPIVVRSQSTSQHQPATTLSSTLPPPTSFQYTRAYVSPLPSSTSVPAALSTVTAFSSRHPSQTTRDITQFTEQTQTPVQTKQTTLSTSTLAQQTTTTPLQASSIAGRFSVPVENVDELQSMRKQPGLSTPGTLTGSFVIYQNDAFLNGPGQQPSLQGGLFGTAVLPQNSLREPSSIPQTIQTSRGPSSTAPTSQPVRTTAQISSGPTPIPFSERPTTRIQESNNLQNQNRNYSNRSQLNTFGPLPLRIRVVGPRGAITNVNINPRVVVASTTTTKRPTTTRTRKTPKPKRNTYEACLSGCKARRDPICAIPLSATWIDPEKLKGFPSVCHMACFNSYKKDAYEKLLDGRCGRLRTRIHTLDSNTKLKREELNKAQYFLDGGDQTVVEVSPLYKK
ncbi:unnamed protein product [Arctia plantaginis]|uniref:Uncharacterized protein n=1 Tax=Arctia plantaginis TaxID=874455 RepID=A0A8S0Z5I1_ARCPL|nr:unnamed protein product [Arctia plantaginis]CAB3254615.1 unnamed protein product [Arctia plantaginis]